MWNSIFGYITNSFGDHLGTDIGTYSSNVEKCSKGWPYAKFHSGGITYSKTLFDLQRDLQVWEIFDNRIVELGGTFTITSFLFYR